MKAINLDDLRPKDYNEDGYPCLICGKSVEKIENYFDSHIEDFMNGEPKFVKWFNKNYLKISTDGNIYFAWEKVAEGEDDQGCFAVGCNCMKKYRALRAQDL